MSADGFGYVSVNTPMSHEETRMCFKTNDLVLVEGLQEHQNLSGCIAKLEHFVAELNSWELRAVGGQCKDTLFAKSSDLIHIHEAIQGVWISHLGECNIFRSRATNKLTYEEVLNGHKIIGWLSPIADMSWQAHVVSVDSDIHEFWHDSPEIIGEVEITLIAGSPLSIDSRIRVAGVDAHWQAPVRCRKLAQQESGHKWSSLEPLELAEELLLMSEEARLASASRIQSYSENRRKSYCKDLLDGVVLWSEEWGRRIPALLSFLVEDVGVPVNYRSARYGCTAVLHRAVCCASAEVVGLLLTLRADANIQDKNQQRPLHWAGYYSGPDVVKSLLEERADVNARNSFGETPLATVLHPTASRQDAVHTQQLVFSCFLLAKADPNAVDKKYLSVLMRAVNADANPCWLVRELVSWRADINLITEKGSALDMCIERMRRTNNGKPGTIMRLLLELRGDVNQQTCGTSLLHKALIASPVGSGPDGHGRFTRCVQLLLQCRATSDTCCCGRPPLQVALETHWGDDTRCEALVRVLNDGRKTSWSDHGGLQSMPLTHKLLAQMQAAHRCVPTTKDVTFTSKPLSAVSGDAYIPNVVDDDLDDVCTWIEGSKPLGHCKISTSNRKQFVSPDLPKCSKLKTAISGVPSARERVEKKTAASRTKTKSKRAQTVSMPLESQNLPNCFTDTIDSSLNAGTAATACSNKSRSHAQGRSKRRNYKNSSLQEEHHLNAGTSGSDESSDLPHTRASSLDLPSDETGVCVDMAGATAETWLGCLQGSWVETNSVHLASSYLVTGDTCIRYRSWAAPQTFAGYISISASQQVAWGLGTYIIDTRRSSRNRIVWIWNRVNVKPLEGMHTFEWRRIDDDVEEAPHCIDWQRLCDSASAAYAARSLKARTVEPLSVLWMQGDAAVISKPAGVRVVSAFQDDASDAFADSICIIHSAWASGLRGWLPVNRLDTNTTGAMLISRAPLHAALLMQQFAERTVSKEYMCIVHGTLEGEGLIDLPILHSSDGKLNVSRVDVDKGKSAITRYSCISTFRMKTSLGAGEMMESASLLCVQIYTGRTHQIRCHLAHLGHPLCGDTKYGGKTSCCMTSFPQLLLHASRIGFSSPSDEWVVVADPLPTRFATAVETLTKRSVMQRAAATQRKILDSNDDDRR